MTEEQQISEEENREVRTSRWASIGIFFTVLGFLIIAGALFYSYFALSSINITLAKNIDNLETQVSRDQNQITTLKTTVEKLQQSLQKSESLSAQQEKLISEWKEAELGNTNNKWRVAEAQHLTKMAQDYLQFSRDSKIALLLVQQANTILANLEDPNIVEIRKSLTSDVTNLQALPQVDRTSILLQLNALNDRLDKLPFPKQPLEEDTTQAQQQSSPISKDLPWWKAGLEYTEQALSKIVIIRKSDGNAQPLVLPEEKQLIYQNLHAQMANAIWGLLHDNETVYQTSLTNMINWIKKYFAQDSEEIKMILQELAALQKAKITTNNYNLANTLQQFDNYFAPVKAQ